MFLSFAHCSTQYVQYIGHTVWSPDPRGAGVHVQALVRSTVNLMFRASGIMVLRNPPWCKGWGGGMFSALMLPVTSYADALWTHCTIFLSHQSWKKRLCDCRLKKQPHTTVGGYVVWAPLKFKGNKQRIYKNCCQMSICFQVFFILYFSSLEVVIWCLKMLTTTLIKNLDSYH